MTSATLVQASRCALHRGRLDRRLALGVEPGSDPDLALRARQLVSPRHRTRMAHAVRRVIAEIERPHAHLGSVAPLSTAATVCAVPALSELAHVLDSGDRVTPQGVAMVARLLGDPGSPLNSGSGCAELIAAAREIRGDLTS